MTGRNLVVALSLGWFFGASALAAHGAELTACGIVTAAEAERLVGGPLEVSRLDKKIMINAPWTHDSLCTYISKGDDVDSPAGATRFLDVSLRFFESPEAAQKIHDTMIEQFRKLAAAPDVPFKFTNLEALAGFADQAFLVELIADVTSGYKSAQILFYQGKIGGSIAAWKKPDSSLETTKAALKHLLNKLP